MTLPRDVILDLLPVYLGGDVSTATRNLVDDYLRADPELAARVRASTALELDAGASTAVSADAEMAVLRATRRRLALMRWLFGSACFFSALSLGVEVNHSEAGTTGGLLLVRYPSVMIYPAGVALALWISYFVMRRRQSGGVA